MSSTSATGGYLNGGGLPALPGGLTFKQFVQQVFVGVSGLPGDLVRPGWQLNPPKQPDACVDWLAISIIDQKSDTNAWVGFDSNGNTQLNRHEEFEVKCSFYGPNADEMARAVRDGFQIPQNLEALKLARMGFKEANHALHIPDLENERWIDRYEMSVFLRRQILRSYPVLSFASASGSIQAVVGNGNLKTLDWNAKPTES